MPRRPLRLPRRWPAACALAAALAARAASGPAPLVRLPEYTVKDASLAAPRESWRRYEIPGYEILSRAPAGVADGLAEILRRFDGLLPQLYPPLKATNAFTTRLLLCADRAQFESFIPAGVRAAVDPKSVNRLFLRDEAGPIVLLYFGAGQGASSYDVDLGRAYVAGRLASAYPALPAWYVEGISQIYGAIQIIDWSRYRTIYVGKMDDRPPATRSDGAEASGSGPPAEGNELLVQPPSGLSLEAAQILRGDILGSIARDADSEGGGSAPNPDLHLLSFRKYFIDTMRSPVSFAELFAGPAPGHFEDWSQTCGLFVHYCIYGHNGQWLPALEQFFRQLSAAPDADPARLFQQAFHGPYAVVGDKLGLYIQNMYYRGIKYTFARPRGGPPPASAEATDGETADLKAAAYRAAGYPALAGAELVSAYRRETATPAVEPRLLAALGEWEEQSGRPERGEALLAAAAAARWPDARLYLAQARARLSRTDPGRPLGAAETDRCLGPVIAGLAAVPPTPGMYRMIAEIWTRSAVAPAAADHGVLEAGTRAFPGDEALCYDAAAAYLHLGDPATAEAILARGLRSGTRQDRLRLAALQEKIRRASPGPPAGS